MQPCVFLGSTVNASCQEVSRVSKKLQGVGHTMLHMTKLFKIHISHVFKPPCCAQPLDHGGLQLQISRWTPGISTCSRYATHKPSPSQQRWGTHMQLVVFFGVVSIGTQGGWGAKAWLQACSKVVERPNSGKPTERLPGKVVTVDKFCIIRLLQLAAINLYSLRRMAEVEQLTVACTNQRRMQQQPNPTHPKPCTSSPAAVLAAAHQLVEECKAIAGSSTCLADKPKQPMDSLQLAHDSFVKRDE
ncbi:hypothetical protein QJQ45_012504 [Haematococcus lacustris]|nr:hypothetical protein QJQ45_012504 [Haematococcus lacustris]